MTKKVKQNVGIEVMFEPVGFYEEDFDTVEEYEACMNHSGETCKITGCSIDVDGDFESSYWDIEFEDGYDLVGVQGVSLVR